MAAYLRAHGTPSDTVVVGFGHPNIVWDSGLRSPYRPALEPRRCGSGTRSCTSSPTSCPGRTRPTWIVVNGTSLATWGVDPTAAQTVLDQRYRPATTIGEYVIWKLVPWSASVR